MHLLAENQVVVSPPKTCEQAEVSQILPVQTINLSEIEELKVRILGSPRVDVVDKRVHVPIFVAVKGNQPAQGKTGPGMPPVEVTALTNDSTVSDNSVSD